MIKENERLLTLFRVLVDAVILIGSFMLSYYLRFDKVNSPLIRWEWIGEPLGYYSGLGEYMQCLFVLVPAYIVSYFFFKLYDPKRVKSRKAELAHLRGHAPVLAGIPERSRIYSHAARCHSANVRARFWP